MTSAIARLCSTSATSGSPDSVLSTTSGDFASLAHSRLLWLPDLGIGYLDVPPVDGFYGESYWQHYRMLDSTETGRKLTEGRIEFVRKHYTGSDLVDIGIGGGAFVEQAACWGWDVNPRAIAWLFDHKLLRDPRSRSIEAATMFDSLEHMENPSEILRNVTQWAFISTPIYDGPEHCLRSKHLKRGEHLFYFTLRGLTHFMLEYGFTLEDSSTMEVELGRESIGTFAFRRSHWP